MTHPLIIWSRRILAPLVLLALLWVVFSGSEEALSLAPNMGVRAGIATVVGFAGLVLAGLSWSSVSEAGHRRGVASFGATLPLRHLPLGGLGQIAGLSGLTMATGTEKRRTVLAAPSFLIALAAGASLVALPLVWKASVPLWLRLLVIVGSGAALLFAWRGSTWLGTLAKRWVDPERAVEFGIPIAWSTASAVGTATAFAVLFPFADSFGVAVVGFAAAWLCGFLFVISPAGLGAREAVLVLLFSSVDPSVVIATALAHRLTTLVAEILLFLLAWWLSKDWVHTVETVE